MEKKNSLLILLSISLNIIFFNYSSSEDKEIPNQKLHTLINKKWFTPIATTAFLTLGTFAPVIFNPREFTTLGAIKNCLKSIEKKDLAVTGLKSFFIASSLKKEFKDKNNGEKSFIDEEIFQKISLLALLGLYTHRTIADLLKAETPQNLSHLFEKTLINYSPIIIVNTAIKGMQNNNEPLLKKSKIPAKGQKYAYDGILFALMCLWEYGIQKNITSPDNLLKTVTDFITVCTLTTDFDKSQNYYLKQLLIFGLFFNAIRKFYKNSQSNLEYGAIKSISLEDITSDIGKIMALPRTFNNVIDFFNQNVFSSSMKPKEDYNELEE